MPRLTSKSREMLERCNYNSIALKEEFMQEYYGNDDDTDYGYLDGDRTYNKDYLYKCYNQLYQELVSLNDIRILYAGLLGEWYFWFGDKIPDKFGKLGEQCDVWEDEIDEFYINKSDADVFLLFNKKLQGVIKRMEIQQYCKKLLGHILQCWNTYRFGDDTELYNGATRMAADLLEGNDDKLLELLLTKGTNKPKQITIGVSSNCERMNKFDDNVNIIYKLWVLNNLPGNVPFGYDNIVDPAYELYNIDDGIKDIILFGRLDVSYNLDNSGTQYNYGNTFGSLNNIITYYNGTDCGIPGFKLLSFAIMCIITYILAYKDVVFDRGKHYIGLNIGLYGINYINESNTTSWYIYRLLFYILCMIIMLIILINIIINMLLYEDVHAPNPLFAVALYFNIDNDSVYMDLLFNLHQQYMYCNTLFIYHTSCIMKIIRYMLPSYTSHYFIFELFYFAS